MKGIAAAVLAFETITVLLAALLGATATDRSPAVVWGVFGGLAVLCVVAAGLVRRGRVGWVLGSAAQVVAVLSGLVVSAMFFLGALFAALWVLAYVLDRRLAAARATAAGGRPGGAR